MTRLNLSTLMLLTLTLLLSAPLAARAAESYDNCTGFITSVPTVINTQGTWCMKSDLATAITSGNAITINNNNVTVDCNDFKLGGLAAGISTSTNGIFAFNRSNFTVRHCSIRGFYVGVELGGASGGGHAIEDNRFDSNTFIAIDIQGDGSVVRRNLVSNSGGSTNNVNAYGIATSGSANVLDNSVSGVIAASGGNGSASGIATFLDAEGQVSGNGVRGVIKDGTGVATGIENINSGRIVLRNIDVIGDGSAASTGLYCENSDSSANDNVIGGFVNGIKFCTNSGGNDISP
jgi:hypothetical protein